jgi:hypothetical protein
VIVEPREKGAAQRYNWNSGRGLESRNQANQVTAEDEKAQRYKVGKEFFVTVANDLVANATYEALDPLENMLQGARPIDGEASANKQKSDRQKPNHEHFHGEWVCDRGSGVIRLDAKQAQQGEDGTPQKVIQELSKDELFHAIGLE